MKKLLDKKITELLPHREPFLFVDKILFVDSTKIVTSKTIREDEGYLKGHFPDNPIVPGVLIIESMAQSAGLLLAHESNNKTNNAKHIDMLYLSRVTDIKLKASVFPEETLTISAELLGQFTGSAKFSVKVEAKGKIVAEGELVLSTKKKNGGGK
ncbi:MAG: beta-hydroxyacyl-ACP dehydratase [Candidatus Omnitrophica bacterium]|nr:beta-hydroxyacyl-ACP dehydratase [Candidatus Omnitrophota bacterium]